MISTKEQTGLKHFLNQQTDDTFVLTLAKIIANNIVTEITQEEAINIIMLHSSSIHSILNRKIVTKEILLKYLTDNNISVSNFTKIGLIEKVLGFWNSNEPTETKQESCSAPAINPDSKFPINVFAAQFGSWFFNRFNENTIDLVDFWENATCAIRIVRSDQSNVNDETTSGNSLIIEMLRCLKNQLNIKFVPNLEHNGIQGRMDNYGLVFVLCCGTLYNNDAFAGVFEIAFGLCKDAANVWRIKYLKLQIKYSNIYCLPNVEECSSLQEFIRLPLKN